MGASKTEVAKGQLTKRIVQKGQKVADYQGIIDQLEQEGAIAIAKNKASLSAKGQENARRESEAS
jgi:predicted methyltransferase